MDEGQNPVKAEVESDEAKLARANRVVSETLRAYGIQPDDSFDQNWVHLDRYVTGLQTTIEALNEKVRVLEDNARAAASTIELYVAANSVRRVADALEKEMK